MPEKKKKKFILYLTGPASERPYTVEGDPLNFGPRLPWEAHPKNVFPKFPKILRGGGQLTASKALKTTGK